MARKDDEDALTAAQRREARTRRSFFPAANALTDTGQGQVLIPAGGSLGGRALPPDQNPAYQAALSRGRPSRANYTRIPTAYGSMAVPTASKDRYAALIKGVDEPTPMVASTGTFPSEPFSMVPSVFPAAQQGPILAPAPMSGGEQFGAFLRKPDPITTFTERNLRSFGSGIARVGRDIYRGATGQRNMLPVGGEIGGYGSPTPSLTKPQNPWQSVTDLTTYGKPRRYFE